MSRFVVIVPPPHRCIHPSHQDFVATPKFGEPEPGPGSIWECDCGKRWKHFVYGWFPENDPPFKTKPEPPRRWWQRKPKPSVTFTPILDGYIRREGLDDLIVNDCGENP